MHYLHTNYKQMNQDVLSLIQRHAEQYAVCLWHMCQASDRQGQQPTDIGEQWHHTCLDADSRSLLSVPNVANPELIIHLG